VTDRELLEQRLDLFQHDGWRELVSEFSELAQSLEKIYDIENIETLQLRKGQVTFLNMFVNMEESTKLTLEQLDE
jgi:hypothetical protein